MFNDDYAALVYQKTGSRYRPDELIAAWGSTIDRFVQGFNDIENELEFDLFIRSTVQNVIDDPELAKFEDHKAFVDQIQSIDSRFKDLFFENPKYKRDKSMDWWDWIILKKGKIKYYNEIKMLYNIEIELID